MNDFYWDIRPKPEFGTVEVRVCDTPNTADRAVALAGYVQALAAWLFDEQRPQDLEALGRVYSYNRFQACRFGMQATLIDPETGRWIDIQEDLLETLARVTPHAHALGADEDTHALHAIALARRNDATILREEFDRRGALADVVRWQCQTWEASPPRTAERERRSGAARVEAEADGRSVRDEQPTLPHPIERSPFYS